MKTKKQLRQSRRLRIRAKVKGTSSRPRLAVFRSHQALYVQLIDDEKGVTLVAGSARQNNQAVATALGREIAAKARTRGITRVVFDRGGFRYHGGIKALAEAVRAGGLKF